VFEAQRQHAWFACLKTLPILRKLSGSGEDLSMFRIQDTGLKPKIIPIPFSVTGVAIQPPIKPIGLLRPLPWTT
jgi:hypothetical protein